MFPKTTAERYFTHEPGTDAWLTVAAKDGSNGFPGMETDPGKGCPGDPPIAAVLNGGRIF